MTSTKFLASLSLGLLLLAAFSCDTSEARPKRSKAFDVSNEAVEPQSLLQVRTPNEKHIKEVAPKPVRPPHLRIRSAPTDITLPVGGSRVLECEAGGNPPPRIHWLKDGKRISQNLDEVLGLNGDEDMASPEGVLGLSFTRSRLYIDCAQALDAGVYTCVAENAYSRVSAESNVKVVHEKTPETEVDNSVALCMTKKSYGSPARIHMWTRTRLELIGSEVRLFCRASGSPQPTLSWVGPDDTPLTTSQKYTVLENGDLIIKELAWEDMGGYTCVAANANGEDRSLTFLYPTMPEK